MPIANVSNPVSINSLSTRKIRYLQNRKRLTSPFPVPSLGLNTGLSSDATRSVVLNVNSILIKSILRRRTIGLRGWTCIDDPLGSWAVARGMVSESRRHTRTNLELKVQYSIISSATQRLKSTTPRLGGT